MTTTDSPATATNQPNAHHQSTPAERSAAVIAGLAAYAPDHILHLPSSTLITIIDWAMSLPGVTAFPTTREDEAVGIAAGLRLGGARPVMIIQDNGLGNALTALATFPQAYHIPLPIIVSMRGGLNEYNSMIHTFCEHTEAIAGAAGLRYFTLDGRTPIDQWRWSVQKACDFAEVTHRPVLVFVNLMGG